MNTQEKVKTYYGKVLQTSKDLKTSACCSIEALPAHTRELLKNVHMEIQEKFYGCGSPLPLGLKGQHVLDLGCGTGRDVYLLSQLVGQEGHVTGIDMTDEQLAVANKHLPYQMDKFGYQKPNVSFVQGFIEDLKSAGIKDNTIDLVVSNCVTNLSPDKPQVFSEIFRVLKPGGELYFSDVFASRRLPQHCQEDPILLGECLGGAMYIQDFRRLLLKMGIQDYRIVTQNRISLSDPEIVSKIGDTEFYSITFRAFKITDLEDRCEDYGQVAYYQGTIPESPLEFRLDDHHLFRRHTPLLVCSNTAKMLTATRFSKHFKVLGNTDHHLGLFDCNPETPRIQNSTLGASCC